MYPDIFCCSAKVPLRYLNEHFFRELKRNPFLSVPLQDVRKKKQ